MICRSPEEFTLPENANELYSVPLGIAFGEDEFKPYTLGTTRFRFYPEPRIESCVPEEVRIGKFSEIYVYAYDDALFFERKSSFDLSSEILIFSFLLQHSRQARMAM